MREETGELQDPDTGEIPVVRKSNGRYSADPNDPEVAAAIHHEQLEKKKAARSRRFRGRVAATITVIIAVLALCGIAGGAYMWSQRQYFLAKDGDTVAIYQGVPTDIFGIKLSHPVEQTNLTFSELPEGWQNQLEAGINVDDYDAAVAKADQIEQELRKTQQQRKDEEARRKAAAKTQKDAPEQTTKGTATPSPSASSSASPSATAEEKDSK